MISRDMGSYTCVWEHWSIDSFDLLGWMEGKDGKLDVVMGLSF